MSQRKVGVASMLFCVAFSNSLVFSSDFFFWVWSRQRGWDNSVMFTTHFLITVKNNIWKRASKRLKHLRYLINPWRKLQSLQKIFKKSHKFAIITTVLRNIHMSSSGSFLALLSDFIIWNLQTFSGLPLRPPDGSCLSQSHHPIRSALSWWSWPVSDRKPVQQ